MLPDDMISTSFTIVIVVPPEFAVAIPLNRYNCAGDDVFGDFLGIKGATADRVQSRRQHPTLFLHLHIGETIVGRYT